MTRTKIIILQLKEIIYTAIFAALSILLLILLFFMFWPHKEKKSANTSRKASQINRELSQEASETSKKYIAGVYTSKLSLGDAKIDLKVTLDQDHVKSVEVVHLKNSVETMYPLIKPAVKDISKQLARNVSPQEVVLSEDSPYTSQLILDTVCHIMDEASIKNTR